MSSAVTPAMVPRQTRYTADQLLVTEFSSLQWLVPKYVPMGLSLLAGKPKIGKSWLCLQLAEAVASGGQFLGEQIDQGDVLYFALEDNPRRLNKRLKRQGGACSPRLEFEIMNWPGWKNIEREIAERRYRLVIIDTLSRALTDWDQNDVSDTTRVFDSLQKAAMEHEMTVLGVDHHRKGTVPSQGLEGILGSTAKGAVADAILQLHRERRDTVLQISGRDIEEEYELAVRLESETCCWQLIGAANEPNAGSIADLVLDEISTLTEEGTLPTTTSIATKLGRDPAQVSRCLGDLMALGSIVKGTKKGKEQPYHLRNEQAINGINKQSCTQND
jgi:hypothetical protein